MNQIIMLEDAIKVVKTFMSYTDGDEALERFILAMSAELLGVSVDTILEMIK